MDPIDKIALGSVQFGLPYGISNSLGQTSPQEVSTILHIARKNGINLIDTAFAYGNAERILGENDLASFKIVSKFKALAKGESPLSQLKVTLESLRAASLHGYLAHRPKDILDCPGCWDELQQAKKLGQIIKIGFSLNEPEEFDLLFVNGFKPDIVQVPYNFIDRRFENIMKQLKQLGCEIHSRSTFLQGLFFLNPDSLPTFFDEVKPVIRELNRSTNDLSGALLKFVLSKPFIDKVVLGVNNIEQLESNLKSIRSSVKPLEGVFLISDNVLMPSKWPKI